MFTLLNRIRAALFGPPTPPAIRAEIAAYRRDTEVLARVNATWAARAGRSRAEILAELAELAPLRHGRDSEMAECVRIVVDLDLEQLAGGTR